MNLPLIFGDGLTLEISVFIESHTQDQWYRLDGGYISIPSIHQHRLMRIKPRMA